MKRFRLLLACAAMFALIMPFTACTDDQASDVKKPTVSLEVGEAGPGSVSFVVSTSNATTAYYWVYPADVVVEQWEIADGTSVDCGKDSTVKAVEVTVSSLEPGKEYKVYAVARNFLYSEMAEPVVVVPGAYAAVPAASFAIESFTESSIVAKVTTANVDKASIIAVPKYTEVSAAKIFEQGVALAVDQLNQEVSVTIEDLADNATYDVYLAAALGDVVVVKGPEVVTLPEAALKEVTIEALTAASIMTPAHHGIPGVYWLQMMDDVNWSCNVSMMFIDMQNPDGYLSNGFFPVNTSGDYDPTMGTPSSEDLVLLSNPGYTAIYGEFGGKELELFPVVGQDPEMFGVSVQTLMPTENNNYVAFMLLCKTDAEPSVTKASHVVMGTFMGPIEGYAVGGGAGMTTERELEYSQFTMSSEGKQVTVTFNGGSSTTCWIFNTESGVLCPEVGTWYQYSIDAGTLSPESYYFEVGGPNEEWMFYMTAGGVRVKKESDTVYWFYVDGLTGEMTSPQQMTCTFTDSGAWKPTLVNN